MVRPAIAETTCLGAAYAAGLAVGFWPDLETLRAQVARGRALDAAMRADDCAAPERAAWDKAVCAFAGLGLARRLRPPDYFAAAAWGPAMADNLIESLALERIEVNLFRGTRPQDQGPRIFGGLVIAQALLAAYETVEDRVCHSLHCYFIRPGDPSVPILYEVDRSRDGRSFTTRRVTAIQHGEQIFNLAASFQVGGGARAPGSDARRAAPRRRSPRRPEHDAWEPRDRAAPARPARRRRRPSRRRAGPERLDARRRRRSATIAVINQAALAYASDMSLHVHRACGRTA